LGLLVVVLQLIKFWFAKITNFRNIKSQKSIIGGFALIYSLKVIWPLM
jgi:hypothetical protein